MRYNLVVPVQQDPYSDLVGFKPYMAQGHVDRLRIVMLGNGFEWQCSECLIDEWLGVPAPLQVDHVDGDRFNNCRTNLRFLCPNCHALTDTFSGRNRRLPPLTDDQLIAAYDVAARVQPLVSVSAVMRVLSRRPKNRAEYERVVRVCALAGRSLHTKVPPSSAREKIRWPSDNELAALLAQKSRVEIGEMLGVSDNAILKRCSRRGIEIPTVRRSRPRTTSGLQAEATRDGARRNRRLKRLRQLHGTRSGYLLERRLDLEPCQKCRRANAAYTKALRRPERETAA